MSITSDDPQILAQQGFLYLPQPEGTAEVTNPVPTPRPVVDRLAHMPDDIYDLSAESHLVRVLKVLLGDVGAGRLEKAALLARLQHSLHGSHFYDLDRFYGALFGAQRFLSEALDANPYEDSLTDEEWEAVGVKDDAFRCRVEQLARAINFGATPTGMELAAEALLGCDVDIYESFVTADRALQTYGDLEGVGTYGDLEAFTYGELEAEEGDPTGSLNRCVFNVVPKREITEEERYDVIRVLSVLKPADTILRVRPLGQPTLTPVAIRDIAADSEMWRIEQKTPQGGSPAASKVRPPFTAYQGEAWSHVSSVAGVASYLLDADGEVALFHLVGVTSTTDAKGKKHIRYYTPDLAVASIEKIMSGRAVSDGILARHPYGGAIRGNPVIVYHDENYYNSFENFRPEMVKGQTRTNILTDGYYLYEAGALLPYTQGALKTNQDFWATPERPQADTSREVVEMRFRSPVLVNHLSLELPRFPHTATVQGWDADLGEWVSLRQWTVSESFPEITNKRVASPPSVPDTRHPQHSAAGHWMKASDTVAAMRTERLRVVLQRGPYGDPPKDWRGRAIPYSLGVRNWDVGYRIRSRDDIPTQDESLGGGFATTIDSRGNTVVLDVVESLADNLLDGSMRTWRCEPQPTNRAVVNLYLDTRDASGEGQVIDTFRIDPSKSGPHVNLYWSDQDGTGPFEAPNKDLDLRQSGVITNTGKGLRYSDADSAWIALDNSQIQFDPNAAWWMGMRFTAMSPTVDSGSLRLLASFESLYVVAGYDSSEGIAKIGVIAVDDSMAPVASAITAFDAAANDDVVLSVWKDGDGIHLAVSYRDQIQTADAPLSGSIKRPESLYVGGGPGMPGSDIFLTGFFLKVTEAVDPIEAMRENFPAYLIQREATSPAKDYTESAIVRYSPSFSSQDRIVFRGGSPRFFESLVWHPVEREYKVTRGFLRVPPVAAKFWCFEFTDLVPEPMESFLPIKRHVRLFPPAMSGTNNPREIYKPIGNQWPGMRPGMRMAYDAQYRDTTLVRAGSTWTLPPTAATYVTDLQQKANIGKISWLLGYQPWQIGAKVPRFHEVGLHAYDEFDIIDTSKLGFFVGLQQIEAYRTDYEADDDTSVYRFRFQDDGGLAEGSGWEHSPGRLSAPEQGVTVTSMPLRSRHGVRAVQFASMQSDATQIITDDDFTDESLSTSTWDDESAWHAVGDGQIVYSPSDQTVIVNRDLSAAAGGSGSGGPGATGIIGPVLRPVFSYRDGSTTPVSQQAGGIESAPATTSPRGMLHAAARVTAVTDTENPLMLQILGSDDTVLAESQVFLKKGETKEWSVGYQLGAYTRGGYSLFEPRGLMQPLPAPVAHGDAPTSTGETATIAPDEVVRVRLVQEGASTDSWKVDRLSLFDDGIVWEFSNDGGETWYPAFDVRNSPDGVLVFPEASNGLTWRATAYRPNREISALQIRPWYEHQMGTVMAVPHRGPNVSSFDHEPPIESDPEFKAWANPVPRWWWLAGRRFPVLPTVT